MTLIINILTTVAASFGGAYFAFCFQSVREKRRVDSDRVNALHQAFFAITKQIKYLETLKVRISKYREDPIRCVNLPAIPNCNVKRFELNVNSLMFFLEFREYAVLEQLVDSEEHFREMVFVINKRSEFHIETVQPEISKRGFIGQNTNRQVLEEQLGVFIPKKSEELTNLLYNNLDQTIDILNKTFLELRKAAKTVFPKSKFILLSSTQN